jgi:hypothetical protein
MDLEVGGAKGVLRKSHQILPGWMRVYLTQTGRNQGLFTTKDTKISKTSKTPDGDFSFVHFVFFVVNVPAISVGIGSFRY